MVWNLKFWACAGAIVVVVFLLMGANPIVQPGVTASDAVEWTAAQSSTLNAGTVGTGITVTEFGDGYNRVTRIAMGTGVLAAIAGGANLAVGLLVYTFPAGVIYIDAIHMDVAIDGAAAIQADTPDVGVGTVIATGAVAVLGGTSTFEDLINGTAAADANGTNTDVTTIPNVSTLIVIEAGETHAVHFNAADLWAAGGDATPDLSGDIWIAWRFLGA